MLLLVRVEYLFLHRASYDENTTLQYLCSFYFREFRVFDIRNKLKTDYDIK